MATCGPNPPPPAGTVIWRGAVPAELTAWAISLRDKINRFPDWYTWTTSYNGQTVTARRDRHEWTYRNGQLITGICIPGITLYQSSLAQPVSASTDPTDLSTPDPTAAIFPELPSSIDWQAVAIAGFAATGVIGLFWLAIQGAGHAAEKAKRLPRGTRETGIKSAVVKLLGAQPVRPNPKNKTRLKSLDRIADDPRVEEIWDEGDDGIWVQLAPGFNWEGASTVHEWSVKDLIESFKMVEEGNPW